MIYFTGTSAEDTSRTQIWCADDDPTIDRGGAPHTSGSQPRPDPEPTAPVLPIAGLADPAALFTEATIDEALTPIRGLPLPAPHGSVHGNAPPLAAESHQWVARWTSQRPRPPSSSFGQSPLPWEPEPDDSWVEPGATVRRKLNYG